MLIILQFCLFSFRGVYFNGDILFWVIELLYCIMNLCVRLVCTHSPSISWPPACAMKEKHTYLKQARTWSLRCVAKQRSWSDHGWNTPDCTWSCFTWFSESSLFIIFDLVWWRLRLMPPLFHLLPPLGIIHHPHHKRTHTLPYKYIYRESIYKYLHNL